MARPYSVDLRERVLRAHEAGAGSHRVLAERFAVSAGTGWGGGGSPPGAAGWGGGWARPAAKAAAVRGRMAADDVCWTGRIPRSWSGWWRSGMMRRWRSMA